MIGILDFIKEQILQNANPSGVYIDFTMGNGNDTLFLSKLAPEGKVYAFDIQECALESTKALLLEHSVNNAELICDSHENFDKYYDGEISGGMFNLGWFPGGDTTITTKCDSTREAILKAAEKLALGAVLGIAIYPGHAEGEKEGEMIGELLKELPIHKYDCFMGRLINIPACPYLYIIERRRRKR